MVRIVHTKMPFGAKPRCCMCKSYQSVLWRRNQDGSVICNSCSLKTAVANKNKSNAAESSSASRKGTRTKTPPVKSQPRAGSSGSSDAACIAAMNKNRRQAMRKICARAPNPVLVPSTRSCMFYRGSYLQIGDVVSLLDFEEGIFYAIIKAFLEDQFCEKYAMISWLIPTTKSPKEGFDLKTYISGPEDENPYKLEYLQFVCHCDLDYLFARNSIYPLWPPEPEFDLVLTKSGQKMIPHKEKENSVSYRGPRPFAADC